MTAVRARDRVAVLIGAVAALFCGSLTNTVVGIALPSIVGELGGQDRVAWVAAAALLAMAVSAPLVGKLADRRGPRPVLLASIAVFVGASAGAGLAPSVEWLTVGRALQGAGSGGILACANALVAVLVPARERGRYTGWFGLAFGTASVTGPLIGGLLVAPDGPGWRWCFLGVVPVSVVAAGLVRLAPHVRPPRRAAPLDLAGAGLLAGAAAALVVGLSAGGQAWPWLSVPTGALATTVLVCAALAVRVARRAADPVLPPSVLGRADIGLICLASLLVGTIMFAGIIYLPQFLQVVHGQDPTTAGLLMLPQVGTMILASVLTGRRIARTGRWKRYPTAGCALLVIGVAALVPLQTGTPLWTVAVGTALLGAGVGLTHQVLVLAAQNAAEAHDVGVVGSAVTFTRTLGGAVGVALFGAVIAGRLRADLAGPGSGWRELLGTPARIASLPGPLAEAVRTSYTHGLAAVFLVALPLAVTALIAVACVRETELR